VTEWTADKTLLLCDGFKDGLSLERLAELTGTTISAANSKLQRVGIRTHKQFGRKPVTFTCDHCSETVTRPKYHKYCSRRCSGLANTARADAARPKCPVCGGKRKASSDAVHCSVACGLVANGYANQKHKDDFKAKVRELWDAGVSTRRIADSVNPPVTKNAIIGLVHRMGLPSRPPCIPVLRQFGPPRPPSVRRTVVRDGVQRNIRIAIPDHTLSALPSLLRSAPIIPPKVERMVRVPQDKPERSVPTPFKTCQWITSDHRPWKFCDAPVDPKHGVYCCEHARAARGSVPRPLDALGLVA